MLFQITLDAPIKFLVPDYMNGKVQGTTVVSFPLKECLCTRQEIDILREAVYGKSHIPSFPSANMLLHLSKYPGDIYCIGDHTKADLLEKFYNPSVGTQTELLKHCLNWWHDKRRLVHQFHASLYFFKLYEFRRFRSPDVWPYTFHTQIDALSAKKLGKCAADFFASDTLTEYTREAFFVFMLAAIFRKQNYERHKSGWKCSKQGTPLSCLSAKFRNSQRCGDFYRSVYHEADEFIQNVIQTTKTTRYYDTIHYKYHVTNLEPGCIKTTQYLKEEIGKYPAIFKLYKNAHFRPFILSYLTNRMKRLFRGVIVKRI